MPSYARGTNVDVSQSRADIERTLGRYGADSFGYMTEAGKATVVFRMKERNVRLDVPMPLPTDKVFTEYLRGRTLWKRSDNAARDLYDQAVRERWRAILAILKAKLIGVDLGVTTFEDEFFSQMILPNGDRVIDWARPAIAEAYRSGAMPSFLLEAGRG